MKTFLFICTGNICRSPMAEALFRLATQGRTDYRAVSAGLGAIDGQAPSAHSVRAMKEIGVDISRQRSRMLTADMVKQADYILGMTHSHVDTVTLLYPQAAEKTFLLREFDDTLDLYEKDISDPIGGSYEVYLNCRDQIEQGIASLLRFIEQGETAHVIKAVAGGLKARVAMGADHGGYDLKETLKQYLRERGVTFHDFGTHGKESVDYPDYATLVAHSVAEHSAAVGLLVCTTGIGMSMTANKVSGIRAAVVTDVESALLTRKHNNANVLCLSGRFTAVDVAKQILDNFLNTEFEGGRHERRVNKMETKMTSPELRLNRVDGEIANVIEHERLRQQENIELIASENFTSPAVMEAQG